MITSCSPGWVKYCETFYPDFIPNLSSCKSPHEMLGAIIKTYYAEKAGIDPSNIYVVSIMPCTAKKYESQRDELSKDGLQDVDAVLTVRELAKMIKAAGIDFTKLPDEDFDSLLGESTGAGVIFGATGGVMEAALRTVYELVTGKTLENVDLTAVRGTEGIKEAEVDLDGKTVRVAVAHGTGNASKLLEMVKNGEKSYDFIEIMGCPGGCVTVAEHRFIALPTIPISISKPRERKLFTARIRVKPRENRMKMSSLRSFTRITSARSADTRRTNCSIRTIRGVLSINSD
jgi:NADP-reducing hydrogenase subunit HndD